MSLYEVPLSMSLLSFGNGDYVSQLPYVWYYVDVKSSFVVGHTPPPFFNRFYAHRTMITPIKPSLALRGL